MSDQIKTIQVSAESTKVGGTRKRGKRGLSGAERVNARKVEKQQVGGTSPGTSLQVEASVPLAQGPPKFVSSSPSDLAKNSSNSTPATVAPAAQVQTQAQTGGKATKQVKVVLEKSKKKSTRVVLQPAKVKKLPGVASSKPDKTRKVAKKIRMSIHGLNKRVTRANTISKEAKQEPLDKVKKTLIDAKLIKADSKAPEDIIRKMYRDYMMLKNRAL